MGFSGITLIFYYAKILFFIELKKNVLKFLNLQAIRMELFTKQSNNSKELRREGVHILGCFRNL